MAALRRFIMARAPGSAGYRIWHVLDAWAPLAHGMGSVLIDALVELVNCFLRGQVPLAVRPLFAGAPILPV